MNKKALKLIIWYVAAAIAVVCVPLIVYLEKRQALRTAVDMEVLRVGEASKRAQRAYRHETKPAGINALSDLLMELQKAETMPGYTNLIPNDALVMDIVLTHFRLAKLYAAEGQTNPSMRHIFEALTCSQGLSDRYGLTNQTRWLEFVDRIDRTAHE